jgi:hypothetical protein
LWAQAAWLWETPAVRSVRMAASVANWGVRLPAIAALVLTQASVLSSQVRGVLFLCVGIDMTRCVLCNVC